MKNKNISEILMKLPFGMVQTELQISDRKCVIFTCKHEIIDNFRKKSGIFGALQRRNFVKRKNKNDDRVCRVSTHLYMKFEGDRSTIGGKSTQERPIYIDFSLFLTFGPPL